MALSLADVKKITTKSGVEIKKVIAKSDGTVLWTAIPPTLLVYSATHTLENSLVKSVTEHTKDTAYVSTATYYNLACDHAEDDDDDFDGYASGSKTILSLSSTASSTFKYAKVVVLLGLQTSYGDMNVKLNGTTYHNVSYDFTDPTTKEVTLTLDLSKTRTVTASMELENRSGYSGARTQASCSIKSVTLYN